MELRTDNFIQMAICKWYLRNRESMQKCLDLCQYFGQKKSKDYAVFLSSSSSFCCGVK